MKMYCFAYLVDRTAVFENIVLNRILRVSIRCDPTSSSLKREIVTRLQHHTNVNMLGNCHFKIVTGDKSERRVAIHCHPYLELSDDPIQHNLQRLSPDLTDAQRQLKINWECAAKAHEKVSLKRKNYSQLFLICCSFTLREMIPLPLPVTAL